MNKVITFWTLKFLFVLLWDLNSSQVNFVFLQILQFQVFLMLDFETVKKEYSSPSDNMLHVESFQFFTSKIVI